MHLLQEKPRQKSKNHVTKEEKQEPLLTYSGIVCEFLIIPRWDFLFTVAVFGNYSMLFLLENGLSHANEEES